MKWILEKWGEIPLRVRILGLAAFGIFLGLQAWSVVSTGELLAFKFWEFLGL